MQASIAGVVFAVVVTATVVMAQEAKTRTDTQVTSDNGKVVTMTGCVMIGGSTNFVLTNIISEHQQHDKATSPSSTSYPLIAREGLDLGAFVHQIVEVQAVTVPAATKGDKDDKIEIKGSKKTTVKVARGAANQFLVAAVKTVAPTCEP